MRLPIECRRCAHWVRPELVAQDRQVAFGGAKPGRCGYPGASHPGELDHGALIAWPGSLCGKFKRSGGDK